MKMKRNVVLLVLIVAAIGLAFGCADNSKALLGEDYLKMSNDDLQRYYYRLNDEIESQEKQSGPQVGIGIGGIGGHIGGGIGVGTGGRGYTAEDLRARRVEVRMELKKRGLTP
jgi:hypothetical protein